MDHGERSNPLLEEPAHRDVSSHEPSAPALHRSSRLAALALWSAQLGPDPHDNILRLTALAKELLGVSRYCLIRWMKKLDIAY